MGRILEERIDVIVGWCSSGYLSRDSGSMTADSTLTRLLAVGTHGLSGFLKRGEMGGLNG